MSLQHKIDFAVILTVDHANPNGDPLNGNRPRTDYDGYGEISDVCLKRKIRDRLMEQKGYVTHHEQGARYIYRPAIAPESARKSAVVRLLETFFHGSAEHAVAALLDHSAAELSDEQAERLVALIEQHRQGGSGS